MLERRSCALIGSRLGFEEEGIVEVWVIAMKGPRERGARTRTGAARAAGRVPWFGNLLFSPHFHVTC